MNHPPRPPHPGLDPPNHQAARAHLRAMALETEARARASAATTREIGALLERLRQRSPAAPPL